MIRRGWWALLVAVVVLAGPAGASASTIVADDFVHHRATIIGAPPAERVPAAVIAGQRRIGIVLFDFTSPAGTPITAEMLRAATFDGADSLRAWYDEISHGTLHVVGGLSPNGTMDMYGPRVIARGVGCDYPRWFTEASAGIAVANYDELLMLMPHQAACSWAGLAQTPGRLVILNGSIDLRVTAHESGHTLGLMHAGTLDCGGVPLSDTCSEDDYGDPYDAMGASQTGHVYHFSAFHLREAGFATAGQAVTVTGTGGRLLTESDATSDVTLIRIPRTGDGLGIAYRSGICLETRRANGHFDATMPSPITTGVLVRLCSTPTPPGSTSLPATAAPTRLLNMHPGTTGNEQLDVGQTFTDAAGGVRIRLDALTATTASVAIAVHGQALPPTPPSDAQVTLSDSAKPYWDADVTWTASADANTMGYHVYRDGVLVATLAKTATDYPDGVVEPGATRTFTVVAYDSAAHDSAPATATATADVFADAPATPAIVGVTLTGKTKATIAWQAAGTGPAADHFEVSVDGAVSSTALTHLVLTRRPGAVVVVQVRADTATGRPSPYTTPTTITFPAAGAPRVAITRLGVYTDYRTLKIGFTARDPDGIKSIQLLFDGKVIARPKKSGTVTVRLAKKIKHGKHTLRIVATDRFGATARRTYAYLF